MFSNTLIYAKDRNQKYSKNNISNYFSGLIYMNQANNDAAFKHFKKVQFLKEKHSNYNIQFARTLVLLDKFDQAYSFLNETWNENEYFFESDLLLGLESFLNEDFSKAEKHFKRINNSSNYDFYFEDFLGNMMLAWIASVQEDQKGAENILKKIPERYRNLTNVQSIFIKCYFSNSETENDFKNLILENDLNFSRYNYFLANYLLFQNKEEEAKKKYSSNLLIKETKNFLEKGKIKEIKNFFDCRNPKDSIAEIFYVIANFYSTQEDYRLSNFLYKIKVPLLPKIIYYLQYLLFNSRLPYTVQIGKRTKFAYGGIGIVIHGRSIIGDDCIIGQGITIGGKSKIYDVPKIGNKVYISSGSRVLGNIVIGNNVVIGANSVVVKDVADNCIVAGVPAKVIKKDILFDDYI